MASRLKRLRIDRVDFVDKGANPGASITLAKRHTSKEQGMAEPNVLPEDVAKRMADAEEAVKALTKRAEDAERKAETNEAIAKKVAEDLAVEVEKRETVECEGIAKTLVLPGIEDKVGFVKALRQSPVADQVLAVLKVLAVADRTSAVFKELGSDHPAGAAKDGYERLGQIADALVAKGDFKTRADALPAAMDSPEGKAAYAEYKGTLTQGRA